MLLGLRLLLRLGLCLGLRFCCGLLLLRVLNADGSTQALGQLVPSGHVGRLDDEIHHEALQLGRQALGDLGQHLQLLHAVGRCARDVVEHHLGLDLGHVVLDDLLAGLLVDGGLVQRDGLLLVAFADDHTGRALHQVLLDQLEQHFAHQTAGVAVVVVDLGQGVQALLHQRVDGQP